MQDTRIALLGIILTSHDSVEKLNHLLSQYSAFIIGRLGFPYREKIRREAESVIRPIPA